MAPCLDWTGHSLYAIGVQECGYEPSKETGAKDCEGDWLRVLASVLGPEYALVTVVSMREIRLVLMVHAALMRDISNVETVRAHAHAQPCHTWSHALDGIGPTRPAQIRLARA